MSKKEKIVGIVQARMGSQRFPGKMKANLAGCPLIEWVLRRCLDSKSLDEVVLAVPYGPENDFLRNEAGRLKVTCVSGEEDDVLARFARAARYSSADIVVRICADNPLICASEIDRVVGLFLERRPDYAFNHVPRLGNNYVDGLGAEVLTSELLFRLSETATEKRQREHVTSFIWDNPGEFTMLTLSAPPEYAFPEIRLDVDTKEDLSFLNDAIVAATNSTTLVPAPSNFDVSTLVRILMRGKSRR
ncbi:MAG: NTP transferase domain-containing protein [Bacteroidota bacterium]